MFQRYFFLFWRTTPPQPQLSAAGKVAFAALVRRELEAATRQAR